MSMQPCKCARRALGIINEEGALGVFMTKVINHHETGNLLNILHGRQYLLIYIGEPRRALLVLILSAFALSPRLVGLL